MMFSCRSSLPVKLFGVIRRDVRSPAQTNFRLLTKRLFEIHATLSYPVVQIEHQFIEQLIEQLNTECPSNNLGGGGHGRDIRRTRPPHDIHWA